MIKIYDFPHGARGLRVAWLCEEIGLAHTFVPVSFPPDGSYRALNAFGTVPFLQDGSVSMSESVAMMFYIAQKYGPTDALPPIDDERFAKVLQFTLLGEASLSSLMTPLLAVRFGAPDDQKRNWSAIGIESRLKRTIDRIGDELGDREQLSGAPVLAHDSCQTFPVATYRELASRCRPGTSGDTAGLLRAASAAAGSQTRHGRARLNEVGYVCFSTTSELDRGLRAKSRSATRPAPMQNHVGHGTDLTTHDLRFLARTRRFHAVPRKMPSHQCR